MNASLGRCTFLGTPPTQKVTPSFGVADVEVDGHTLGCQVTGSFQPLLDAVRGYEVFTFLAGPAATELLESVSGGKEGHA